MPKLLDNQSTPGYGKTIDWNGNQTPGTLKVNGVWNGAMVVLEGSIKDDNIDNPQFDSLGANSSFMFNTTTTFQMSPGRLRAAIINPGPSTKLNMDISPG